MEILSTNDEQKQILQIKLKKLNSILNNNTDLYRYVLISSFTKKLKKRALKKRASIDKITQRMRSMRI